MAVDFKLPEIGEGVIEGEIVDWHVAVGDTVHHDQPIVAILTDKATVEITSPFSGTIASLNGGSGDLVEVGATLVTYHPEGEQDTAAEPAAPKNAALAQTPKPTGGQGALFEFPLPEIGEGVMEGEIVDWHVRVGDFVTHDQPVVAVLTDKATVEITAPVDGRVVALEGITGDIIEVGQTIMTLETAEGGEAAISPSPQSAAASTTGAVPATAAAPVTVAASEVEPGDNPSISAFGTPLATPAVRRMAAQQGIDLTRVRGTGPNHRITHADVERVAAAPPVQVAAPVAAQPQTPAAPTAAPAAPAPVAAAPAPVSIPAGEGETRERIRGLRKAIFSQMAKSKRYIPHFTYVDEVEMDKLVALRNELKGEAAERGIKLTFLPFIAKAIVLAIRKFPIMNSSIDEEAGEIVYKHYINLGIATATPNGLTVPVIKQADRKSILEMAGEMVEVTDRARNLRSTMDDITGGTFTITSLGRLGGLLATPIINHPEVGILGIHNLQDRAVVRDGQIVVRKMMNISLSFDHRVVDGDVGATFAQEVKRYLEEPGRLMLEMV